MEIPKGKDSDEREVARRRDEALRRAMNTPPTLHKPIGKRKASPKQKGAEPKTKRRPPKAT